LTEFTLARDVFLRKRRQGKLIQYEYRLGMHGNFTASAEVPLSNGN